VDLENGFDDLATPEQQDVCTAPNVPRSIWPTQKSKKHTEKGLMTVNAMEMRRNKSIKKK